MGSFLPPVPSREGRPAGLVLVSLWPCPGQSSLARRWAPGTGSHSAGWLGIYSVAPNKGGLSQSRCSWDRELRKVYLKSVYAWGTRKDIVLLFFSPTNAPLGFPFCVSLGDTSGRHHRFLLTFSSFKKALSRFLVILIHFHILRSAAQPNFKISTSHLIQSSHVPPNVPAGA